MPMIDLAFPLRGAEVPADHGYFLLSAVREIVPELHSYSRGTHSECATPAQTTATGEIAAAALWDQLRIHPVNGRLAGQRKLAITDKSRLTLRCDSTLIPALLQLAGKSLKVGQYSVLVGVPTTFALTPAPALYSRLVVIKGYTAPEEFLGAVERQLEQAEIDGAASLMRRSGEDSFEGGEGARDQFIRRTIRIARQEVVGFALAVGELDAEDSIRLQERGLGGRGRLGCGVFVPLRGLLNE